MKIKTRVDFHSEDWEVDIDIDSILDGLPFRFFEKTDDELLAAMETLVEEAVWEHAYDFVFCPGVEDALVIPGQFDVATTDQLLEQIRAFKKRDPNQITLFGES